MHSCPEGDTRLGPDVVGSLLSVVEDGAPERASVLGEEAGGRGREALVAAGGRGRQEGEEIRLCCFCV